MRIGGNCEQLLQKRKNRIARKSKLKLYSGTKRKVSHFRDVTHTIAAAVNKNHVEVLKKINF